jgi:hypothetical protein
MEIRGLDRVYNKISCEWFVLSVDDKAICVNWYLNNQTGCICNIL